MAVKVNADVRPALGWTVFGPVTANVDSVWLYSVDDLPHSLNSVETVPIVRSGLKDTTKFDARIEPIPGVRIIPDRIILTCPWSLSFPKAIRIGYRQERTQRLHVDNIPFKSRGVLSRSHERIQQRALCA
ncbi:hypothetical protein [Muribaculum gordoncarteri]|uniref:hypothetical protein n=1 Tax=Muribaculum gordoncarteri TaxID=2530390 RepID=UPI003F671011